jgi:hypothetical protein
MASAALSRAPSFRSRGPLLTTQRHTSLPEGMGGIGGFGQVTTISADGITQRIIQRWPADIRSIRTYTQSARQRIGCGRKVPIKNS